MTRALLQGDVGRAAAANLMLLLLTPLFVVAWVLWWRNSLQGRKTVRLSPKLAQLALATSVVWTIVRNTL